jgi:hypothetical protein
MRFAANEEQILTGTVVPVIFFGKRPGTGFLSEKIVVK